MARERVEFWLDKNKPREKRLLDKIAELKARNKFASTVRKGILLVPELEAGNYEMLAQMYPDVVNKLLAAMIEQGVVIVNPPPDSTPPETPPIDYDKLAKEVATQIVLQGGVNPIEMQSTQPTPGPNPLAAPMLAMPTFDDDDELPTIVTTASNQDSSLNLINGLKGLMQEYHQ